MGNAQADAGLQRIETAHHRQQRLEFEDLVGDVASAVLFVASDAAAFVTGAELVVDGGAGQLWRINFESSGACW